MFSIGETIIYSHHGVCKIIESQEMEVGEKVRDYYVLEPVYEENSTFYVPIGQKQVEEKMHPVLSVDETYALIDTIPDADTIWIENRNERRTQFQEILVGYDRTALIQLIKTLYLHRIELQKENKRLHASDRQFMERAEKVLYDEFAYVLDIDREEVPALISKHLEDEAQSV